MENKTFETMKDFNGAKAKADEIAQEFACMKGYTLIPIKQGADGDEVVDSPMYGWTTIDNPEVAEDIYARFAFRYDIVGKPLTLYVIPTDGTVMLWDDLEEGAIDPATGECEWVDDTMDGAYPLSAWNV